MQLDCCLIALAAVGFCSWSSWRGPGGGTAAAVAAAIAPVTATATAIARGTLGTATATRGGDAGRGRRHSLLLRGSSSVGYAASGRPARASVVAAVGVAGSAATDLRLGCFFFSAGCTQALP